MKQLPIFYFFLITLMTFITFSGQALGEECPSLHSNYRQAIVSLTVEFENKETGETRPGYGTGFIVSPDGYLLTAHHVVSGDDKWNVNFIKGAIGALHGQYSELRFVAKDKEDRDIALLQFKDTNKTYSTVPIGKPGNVKIGKKLCSLSFSFPLKMDYVPSTGDFTTKREEKWVASLSSNLGESGSPVFSEATGRVVAMKYGTIMVDNVQAPNVALLTPLNFAKTLLEIYCDIQLTDN